MSILVQLNDPAQTAGLVDSGGKRKVSAAELGAYEQAGMKPVPMTLEVWGAIPDALVAPLKVGTIITGPALS